MSKIMYKDKQILGCISDAKYAAYDNTGTGLSATNAQDAITELNGKLDKNNLGMPIDLSSYTQSNKYTLPSDGYIQARANSNIPTIMVAIEGKNNDSPTFYLSADWQTDRFATNSIYVKKGMHVYMISQNGGASFYPIS